MSEYKHVITIEPDFVGTKEEVDRQYREWYNAEMMKLFAKGKTILIVENADGTFTTSEDKPEA